MLNSLKMEIQFIKSLLLVLVVTLLSVPEGDSANIVFFLGMSSYSHRIPTWPLAVALAEKGHNVTFVSPIPAKNPHPKVNDYVPHSLKKFEEEWTGDLNFFDERKNGNVGWFPVWMMEAELSKMLCDFIMNDEEYLKFVKETKVDLLFIDTFANECAYGMGHYWGSKVIFYDTMTTFSHFGEAYGLPDESGSIPGFEKPYPVPMTFIQRFEHALINILSPVVRSWLFFPKLDQIVREKLGKDIPSLEVLEKTSTDMVFVNVHHSVEFARALPPNFVPIGGIALEGYKKKPLPKPLEEFINKGNGFVYVSFGSHVDFLHLDKPTQDVFIGTMKALSNLQFVWKVSNQSLLEEFPAKNVFIQDWMPQNDVLAHPKIKAFISHSGLIGLHETIYHGVPVICFPFFNEQEFNADRIEYNGAGVRMEILTVTQPELEETIKMVTTDPKYPTNMKRLSNLFKDRPQKPLETALWWTEYVLRHSKEELKALKPLSVEQTWWVRRQLDVWAVIFLAIGTVFSLVILGVRKMIRLVFGSSASASAKKLKTN